MAQFISLYSGSSGNCNIIRSGSEYLLVDMGKSCRITVNALRQAGLSLRECAGILVTHEHSDHINGLRVFLEKYPGIPLYGAEDTLDYLADSQKIPGSTDCIPLTNRVEQIGGFEVSSFPTSHDVPCVGYRVRTPDGRVMAIATDLGHLTPPVHMALTGCDLVALESNYDPDMLRDGPYPEYLKRRIASSRGHLSNGECAAKLLELVQEGCKRFALCHLSENNNTQEKALRAVWSTFGAAGIIPPPDCIVQAQQRNAVSPTMEF